MESLPADRDGRGLLRGASPDGRLTILAALVRARPGTPLALPASEDRALLEDVDVTPPDKDAAVLRAALKGAQLAGVSARGCVLDGANLEHIVLRGADLASARLRGARLDEGDLAEALLEDVDLLGASARFADFSGATLEGAIVRDADLWGARFEGADLRRADLRGADLSEADLRGADLRGARLDGASLGRTCLQDADLRGVDLETVLLERTDLSGARLGEARLRAQDLTGCTLTRAHLGGTWLERTSLHADQIGDALGEEVEGKYLDAGRGYLALELNFASFGDSDSVRWAYLRRRRMQRRAKLELTRAAAADHAWHRALTNGADYAADGLAEGMCDYGESVSRVILTLLTVFACFGVAYIVTGSMVRSSSGSISRNPMDAVIFSLGAGTTGGLPSVGLRAAGAWVHLITGLQAMLSIALTGLLGFVVGHRIRR